MDRRNKPSEIATPNCWLPKRRLLIPAKGVKLNTLAENIQRYNEAILGSTYCAVVVDLDGVLLRKGSIDRGAFDALMYKTVLNPYGRVLLSTASGRTVGEIGEIFLPEVHSIIQERNAEELSEGDLTVFASNSAVGIDTATLNILYASPLNKEELAKAFTLAELQAIVRIVQDQSVLVDRRGRKLVNRAKIISDIYTYSLGLNLQKLDLLLQAGEAGATAVAEFERLYGRPDNLICVAQRLNMAFEARDIALVATTSGALIDINAKGVSKDLAIQVTRQILAHKTGRSLGEIKPETILSIGDSTLGNDEFLTQRKGGFSNIGPVLPGSAHPIVIQEDGDQFEKVAKFFNKVRLKTTERVVSDQYSLDEDFLATTEELQTGMPGSDIADVFDITGAQKITLPDAIAIMNDLAIHKKVRQAFASFASVKTEGNQQVVFLRGRLYYELLSETNGEGVYIHLVEIAKALASFSVSGNRKLSDHQRVSLLCLLDHGKAYALRLLNTEIEHGFTHDNGEHILAYTNAAQGLVDNYYRTLLRLDRKPYHPYVLPVSHQLTHQEQVAFVDLMREMDQPLPILAQVNYITELMKKSGRKYDYIINPFYGAAELGFALRCMMEIKGLEPLPEIIPVRFSGKNAREERKQSYIFLRQLRHSIINKSLLAFDDNSGTGITLRKLKEELEQYSPSVVDIAVVQVGTTTRIMRVLRGEKNNYNRAILMPEDLTYKAARVYNLKESMRKAQQFMHHVSLHEYLRSTRSITFTSGEV